MFQTENFFINETTIEDIPDVVQLEQDADNAPFIVPFTNEEHLQIINHEEALHLVIIEKSSGKKIGFLILNDVISSNNSMEFRRLVIEDKGNGYGQEVIHGIFKAFFFQLNFHRIWFDVFEENKRAIRLYNYFGFVKEGVLRDAFFDGENYKNIVLMSMLKSEYEELYGE